MVVSDNLQSGNISIPQNSIITVKVTFLKSRNALDSFYVVFIYWMVSCYFCCHDNL